MATAFDRSPHAPMRVAAALVVPTVGVGAHGLASGAMPSTAGILLAVAIGAVVALVWRPRPGRRVVPAVASTSALLTVAQIGAHLALGVGHGAHGGSTAAVSAPGAMLLTHVVAIPLSAVLIVVGAFLLSVLTSTIRAITAPATVGIPARPVPFWSAPLPRTRLVVGGTGLRGPPLTA